LGSITNTARTALVSLSPCIIPYFLATFIVISSIRGNLTSTFFIPLYSIFSLIVLSQAMWLYIPSTERPTKLQLTSLNFFSRVAKVINSEVHTGVKSAGWLKRITHFPEYWSGKLISPWVVIALKLGALSPILGIEFTVCCSIVSPIC